MRWLATGLEARRLWPVGYLNLEENLTLARTDAPVANRRLASHIATTDEGPVRRWWLDSLAAEWMILPAGEALPVATEEVASRGGMRLIRNHAALAVLSLADHPPAPDRPGGGGGDVTAQTLGGNSCSATIMAPSTGLAVGLAGPRQRMAVAPRWTPGRARAGSGHRPVSRGGGGQPPLRGSVSAADVPGNDLRQPGCRVGAALWFGAIEQREQWSIPRETMRRVLLLVWVVPLALAMLFWFRPPRGDDSYHHTINAVEQARAWIEGAVLPRYHRGWNGGTGTFAPTIYSPISQSVQGGLALLAGDGQRAVAISLAVALLVAAVSLVGWSREQVAGLVILSPYLMADVLARSTTTELWALAGAATVLPLAMPPAQLTRWRGLGLAVGVLLVAGCQVGMLLQLGWLLGTAWVVSLLYGLKSTGEGKAARRAEARGSRRLGSCGAAGSRRPLAPGGRRCAQPCDEGIGEWSPRLAE